MRKLRYLLPYLAVMVLLTTACVSRRAVLMDYTSNLDRNITPPASGTIVVCLLIDGLGTGLLERALAAGAVPKLRSHFLKGEGRVHRGIVPFPSVTYPSITSLLTALPIDSHPISGNKIHLNGRLVNFENPFSQSVLNSVIAPLSVFTAAAAKGLTSVSFAHTFHAGATSSYPTDLEAALSYASADYVNVDEKLIDSMTELLKRLEPKAWPSVIFLHLSSVDSITHREGDGEGAVRYLQLLDRKLAPVLDAVTRAEASGAQVISILTADHGFTRSQRYFDVERFVRTADASIEVLNETRFASLYFGRGKRDLFERRLRQRLPTTDGIALYATRFADEVHVFAREKRMTITYLPMQCPDADYGLSVRLESSSSGEPSEPACPHRSNSLDGLGLWPNFISGVAAYFRSPNRADAILVAADDVAFNADQRGVHGGFTVEERTVPILLRNATLNGEGDGFPLHLLLSPFKRKTLDSKLLVR